MNSDVRPNLAYLAKQRGSPLSARLFRRQETQTVNPSATKKLSNSKWGREQQNPSTNPALDVQRESARGGELASRERGPGQRKDEAQVAPDRAGQPRSAGRGPQGMSKAQLGDFSHSLHQRVERRSDSSRTGTRERQFAPRPSGAARGRRPPSNNQARPPQRDFPSETSQEAPLPTTPVTPSPYLQTIVNPEQTNLTELFGPIQPTKADPSSDSLEDLRRQWILEQAGGDYSRYLPQSAGNDLKTVGPVSFAQSALGRNRDVGLGQRSIAVAIVKASTSLGLAKQLAV